MRCHLPSVIFPALNSWPQRSREKQEILLKVGAIASVTQIPDHVGALMYVIPSQASAFSRKPFKPQLNTCTWS